MVCAATRILDAVRMFPLWPTSTLMPSSGFLLQRWQQLTAKGWSSEAERVLALLAYLAVRHGLLREVLEVAWLLLLGKPFERDGSPPTAGQTNHGVPTIATSPRF